MNYNRIYKEFIIDRRNKEKFLKDEYTEKHHIIPRCMGGLDTQENLIRLTPEDHFFAHLLLAKIHGGKLWFAVNAMLEMGYSYRPVEYIKFANKRKNIGFIKRFVAEEFKKNYSGKLSPIADKNVYEFKNVDGRSIIGTRFEVCEKTEINSSKISALIIGSKISYKGWYFPELNPEGIIGVKSSSLKSRSKEIFKLFHFDGRFWEGTQWQFKKDFNRQLVFQNEKGNCAGWYRSKEESKNHHNIVKEKAKKASECRGDISGLNNPKADKNIYKFEVIDTGEIVETTKFGIKNRFKDIKTSNLSSVFSGRQNQTAGIRLIRE